VGKNEFWPRYNENLNTTRIGNVQQLRSVLGEMSGMFIPGLGAYWGHVGMAGADGVLPKIRVIELEGETFLIELGLVGGRVKALTLPYHVFEDYGVYRNTDKVMELLRQTENPAPWAVDPRIDSGGLQWDVDGKAWPYRAKWEDFMEREYGYMSDSNNQMANYFANLSNLALRRPGT